MKILVVVYPYLSADMSVLIERDPDPNFIQYIVANREKEPCKSPVFLYDTETRKRELLWPSKESL